MTCSNSATISSFSSFKYSILIFGLIGLCQSNPLYDVYNVRNEPEAIPMHLLRAPLQIELSPNELGGYAGETSTRTQKRTRHHQNSSPTPKSCCPTVIDVIEPTHGKNRAGDLVELYQAANVRQRFYENSCAPGIANQPCKFLDNRHTAQSSCTQQYSYTYAMVKDVDNESSEWKLDYIQIRSGCSCHIMNSS